MTGVWKVTYKRRDTVDKPSVRYVGRKACNDSMWEARRIVLDQLEQDMPEVPRRDWNIHAELVE